MFIYICNALILLVIMEFSLGDEDNGEQGAWFVLSALGLFAAVPG